MFSARVQTVDYIKRIGGARLQNVYFKDMKANEARDICHCGEDSAVRCFPTGGSTDFAFTKIPVDTYDAFVLPRNGIYPSRTQQNGKK